MTSLERFFQEHTYLPEDKEVVISSRFLYEGKPAVWRIRALREGEFQNRVCYENKDAALCVAAVAEPNLQDPDLWKSYKAKQAEEALLKMLTPGEYLKLLDAVKELNGFEKRKREQKETAKN